jgi:hypothetical protein
MCDQFQDLNSKLDSTGYLTGYTQTILLKGKVVLTQIKGSLASSSMKMICLRERIGL